MKSTGRAISSTTSTKFNLSSVTPTSTSMPATTTDNDTETSICEKKKHSPAEYENSLFQCDETVEFWFNFQRSGLNNASENMSEILNVSNRFAMKGGDALIYFIVINEKKYKLPYDMYQRTEQLSPIFALQQTGLFVQEAVGT